MELKDHIVVFLDLLGFSDRMKAAGGDPAAANALLQEYSRVMTPALRVFEEKHSDLFQYKGFTDNFVLATPLRDGLHPEGRFGTILRQVSDFQLQLALAGWFVRGGIAVGHFFMDQRLVFGPALLEAYDLEWRVARDPRVVLSADCKDWARSFLEFYLDKEDAPQNSYLLIDVDGHAFVNYLDSVGLDYRSPAVEEMVARHKLRVEAALRRFSSSPHIWNKYRWLAEYHDFWVSKRMPDAANVLQISLESLRRNPQLLYEYDLPEDFKIPWGPLGLGGGRGA